MFIIFLLGYFCYHFIVADAGVKSASAQNLYQAYSSFPEYLPVPEIAFSPVDAREQVIKNYLKKYGSPLEPYSSAILLTSDTHKNNVISDLWRYILAIGQCESNLGKKIPVDSFNAWGLGVVTGAKTGMAFPDWETAINYTAKFLQKLMDKNLYSPEEWAATYAPPSILNDHSWAKCVRHFLDEIQ